MKKTIITILILLGLGFAVWVFGTTQGANSPGTVADDNATGTVAWVNPMNATTSDNVYATATFTITSESYYLKATNFGFSIPAGATINGILVEVERTNQYSSEDQVYDKYVKIVKSDGPIGTTNKANLINWPADDTYVSYGSSTDVWDETWIAEDINDVDFGVVLSAYITHLAQNAGALAKVDHIKITITYTEAVAGSGQKVQIKSGKFSIGSGKIQIKN